MAQSIIRQSLREKIIKNSTLYYIIKNIYRFYCRSTFTFHVLPNFLIIGAAKCGTSSLYDHLMEHPFVGKSLTKQIHFFDRYYDRQVFWYRVCFPFLWEKFFVEKIKRQKFSTGEATVHYMTHPLAAQRAHSIVPNAKIIVMLRNPIDRAYSHYNMEKANNKETLSFDDAIDNESKRLQGEFEEMLNNQNNSGRNYPHRAYVKSGEYIDQIKRWHKYYPKENFLYINSEEFSKNPSRVYSEVLSFLQLSSFKLSHYKKIRKREYEQMNSSTREKLKNHFSPFNKQLYEYLGIDFGWDE